MFSSRHPTVKPPGRGLGLYAGAEGETRTRTGFRPPPPQDGVSTRFHHFGSRGLIIFKALPFVKLDISLNIVLNYGNSDSKRGGKATNVSLLGPNEALFPGWVEAFVNSTVHNPFHDSHHSFRLEFSPVLGYFYIPYPVSVALHSPHRASPGTS